MAVHRGVAKLQTVAAGRGMTIVTEELAVGRQATARLRARTRNTHNQALISQLQEVPPIPPSPARALTPRALGLQHGQLLLLRGRQCLPTRSNALRLSCNEPLRWDVGSAAVREH